MIPREKLEEAVEEVTMNDKFTGQFRVNWDKLVNVDRCVKMAKVRFTESDCTQSCKHWWGWGIVVYFQREQY